jgi:aerobic-type carbon monoxide dehydrogenase small subunit (CoxS/CutS family)
MHKMSGTGFVAITICHSLILLFLIFRPEPKRQENAMKNTVELSVNGKKHVLHTNPERCLLQVLREDLDLTGCKYGCGEGRCGACTVLVGGRPVRSCVTEVGSVAGKPIRTVEGLEEHSRLHCVQEAFLKADAMQCGYCTAGMIMSSVALLEEKPDPTEADISAFMRGNICRCGTYARIVQAIHLAATDMKGGAR